MSRYTGWDRNTSEQAEQHVSLSSFTPINQHQSSFKPVPKKVRQHSGDSQQAVATDKDTSKRRKTETATQDSDQETVALGPNQIPNSLHLSTPPKLKSSKKKSTSRKKSSPSGRFPEAPVTKPKHSRRQKLQLETINYQAFTTTEKVVKNPFQLAQTTLDKLAAFKYTPTLPNDQAEFTSRSDFLPANIHEDESQMLLDDEGEEYVPLTESQPMVLHDDDAQLLNLSHFEDAYFEGAEPTTHSPYHGSYTEESHAQNDNEVSAPLPEQFGNVGIYQEAEGFEHHDLPVIETSHGFPVHDVADNIQNFSESDSLEVDGTEIPAASSPNNIESTTPSSQLYDERQFPALAIDTRVNIALGDQSSMSFHLNEINDVATPTFGSQVQQDMNMEEVEFDDSDINDEDLCAMSLGVEQEHKPNAELSSHAENIAFPLDDVASSHAVCDSEHEQITSRNTLLHDDGDRLNSDNPLVCQEALKSKSSPDSGDEFSMDEAEMNALMQLHAAMGTPPKTHSTPSDIPFPSESDSRDMDVFDSALQHSDPPVTATEEQNELRNVFPGTQRESRNNEAYDEAAEENWSFLDDRNAVSGKTCDSKDQEDSIFADPTTNVEDNPLTQLVNSQEPSQLAVHIVEDEEYLPLNPFARPQFPAPMPDRSPVIGFSRSLVLRTCFRIGEALRVAAKSDSASYEVMLELFARVTFSSQEEGTVKQHFQFADIFHDRPPFLNGVLENYKVSDLANTESKQLLGNSGQGQLVRCLGKMKREFQLKRVLVIENIRATDWEEIRRTKMIVEDMNGKLMPKNDQKLAASLLGTTRKAYKKSKFS